MIEITRESALEIMDVLWSQGLRPSHWKPLHVVEVSPIGEKTKADVAAEFMSGRAESKIRIGGGRFII